MTSFQWLKLLAAYDAEHAIWRFPDDDFQASDLLNFPPVLRIGTTVANFDFM